MLLAGVLAVVAVGSMVARITADPTAADELARRLAGAEEPARFSLRYQRGGTQVLGCVLANTRFTSDVDTAAETMVVRRDDGVVALADRDRLLLGSALFRDPPPTAWVAVRRDRAGPAALALRRLLGADLAGYLLASQLPATGRATAAAALDAALAVERIDALVSGGLRADGYRLRLDADRFAAAANVAAATSASTPPTSMSAPEPVPVLDVWVAADGTVLRIGIRPQDSRGEPAPAEDGWVVDYRPLIDDAPPRPAPRDNTEIDLIDPATLVPAPVGCELGG